MAGISAIGAYVPMYRLPRQAFKAAWGTGGGGGERSVGSYDEDTTTMAVAAAIDAINASERDGIDTLFFASTTSSYREKQSAALVAAAADLGPQVRTADFGGCLRAGTSALLAALDAVRAGTASRVLVVASDTRRGYPRSDFESVFGDAAAAVVVSGGEAAVEVKAQASLAHEIVDVWRRDEDVFVRSWEDRFVVGEGYERATKAAVGEVMAKAGLQPKDFARAVIYGPDPRSHAALTRALGFDSGRQIQDHLMGSIGNSGAAHALLMLVAALEGARPGDRLLLASYGDGADALVLEVRQPPKKARAVGAHLAARRVLSSYERFVAYRGVLETNPEPPSRVEPYASATIALREQRQTLRLHASRCNQCGTVAHPIQRVCYTCRALDDYTEARLFDRPGTIFTYTRDNLAGGPEPPVVNCVVESDVGQCRVFSILTDGDPMEARVGMRVEFAFRKMHEGGGFHNYYWKVRPILGGEPLATGPRPQNGRARREGRGQR